MKSIKQAGIAAMIIGFLATIITKGETAYMILMSIVGINLMVFSELYDKGDEP